jgi:hypothetical protein
VIRTSPVGIWAEDPNGGFYSPGDTNHFLWRFFDDFSKDESFVSPPLPSKGGWGGPIVQPDGKILIKHGVDAFDGTSGYPDNNRGLFRLNHDGSVDDSFQVDFVITPQTAYLVASGLTVLPDGRILYGILRFLHDGQRDPTWNLPSVNDLINAVIAQSDGKTVICGRFNRVNGIRRGGLARLNLDGTLDFSFDPSAGAFGAADVRVQGDGRLVVYFEGLEVWRYFPDGRLDPTLQIRRSVNYMGFAMDRTDRIYTVESRVVNQYSGRERLTADAEPVALVLQRSAVVDGSWLPIANIPANTPIDFAISDFPGTGNTFFRAVPAQ